MAQNDWRIGLIAELKDSESKRQINADILNLEKQLDKIKLIAELDFKDKTQIDSIKKQLNNLKINIDNVDISQSAINNLVAKINKGLQGIQIPNINIGGNGSNSLAQQLNNNTQKMNAFRDSLKNIGMHSNDIDRVAQRIERLGVEITSLSQSTLFKSGATGNREILNVEIEGIDKFGQAVKLTRQFDVDLGTLAKSIDAVSTAQAKSGATADASAKKQSQAIANLTNQINQLNRAANDQNASRPISDTSHLNDLSTKYNDIISVIQSMKNVTGDAFTDAQNLVTALISDFKSCVSEYRNMENVSNKMRGTDFSSGLSIAKNDLEKFKAEAKDFPQIIKTINSLNTAIQNVGDASSLNAFNDQLRVARSELAKVKSETTSNNRSKKVGINVDGLQSKIADLQRISPEIDKFETEINGAKVSVSSLVGELSNIKTQSDFSVVNSKWKAFVDAAKAAGIAISETDAKLKSIADKADKIQLDIASETYESKVETLISKTQQWQDANGNARISTDSLQTALKDLNTAYANLSASGGNTEANQRALIAAEQALGNAIKKTTNDINLRNTQFAKTDQVDRLRQKYQEFYDKNTAAHRKWGTQLKAGMAELASGAEVPIQRVNQLEKELIGVQNAARQAGKLGLSFFDKLKQGMASFTMWTSTTAIVMRAIQIGKDMVENVKEIDTAMTSLYKVTDETGSRYDKFLDSASEKAKELGRSVSSLVEQTAEWAKRGYSLAESEELAKTSSIYANVGEIDDETAVSDITTAMKAFNIEANESITIVDKLNNLGKIMPLYIGIYIETNSYIG